MSELILIVARPGRLRDALCALLTTIPQLEIAGQVEDSSAALKIVAEWQPTLVLIDSNLPDNEVRAMLGQIKTEWPQTHCIVLADSVQQQQDAKSAGADEGLLKGFPTANLFVAIEKLRSRQEV
jgi:two-component system, NarL family, nitrate/nitrite response regulator NarL